MRRGLTWTGDDQSPDIDPKLKDRIADLGSITLKVHRKHKGVLKAAGTTGSGWGWDELHEIGQVPEKALKGQALSHEITYEASTLPIF